MYTCLKKALSRPVIYGTEIVKKKWKLRVRFRLENKTNLHYAAVPNRFATSCLTPFLE